MIRRLLLPIAALLLPLTAQAQSAYAPVAPMRLGDYYINVPTTAVVPHGQWELRFTHRFAQPINDSDAHDLWGLDSGADVGIGLTYAPAEKLEVGLFRTNLLDDVELAAKYAVLTQSEHVPIALAVRGGIDWRTQEDYDGDRVSPFVQLIAARQFGANLQLFVAPTFIQDDPLFERAFNVPLGAVWSFRPGLYATAELIPENGDVDGAAPSDIGWAIALKRGTGSHFFEVILANSRATHVDQYVSSAPLGGIDASDVHLGFNIVRRFGTRKE